VVAERRETNNIRTPLTDVPCAIFLIGPVHSCLVSCSLARFGMSDVHPSNEFLFYFTVVFTAFTFSKKRKGRVLMHR